MAYWPPLSYSIYHTGVFMYHPKGWGTEQEMIDGSEDQPQVLLMLKDNWNKGSQECQWKKNVAITLSKHTKLIIMFMKQNRVWTNQSPWSLTLLFGIRWILILYQITIQSPCLAASISREWLDKNWISFSLASVPSKNSLHI